MRASPVGCCSTTFPKCSWSPDLGPTAATRAAGEGASAQDCVGEKGCLFGVSKLCCCVVALSTSNMALGCCDAFCCGRPYGEGQLVEDNENSYMEGVHWCCYALIGGIGCVSPSPCIAADIKVACVETKASTADSCCDDTGCVSIRLKTCCCIHQVQLPPSRSLGLGCCCLPCIKRDRLQARDIDLRAAS